MAQNDEKKREGTNIEGILGGLGELLDKLGSLAEKGERLSRTGEINWEMGDKTLNGIYGYSVKFGLGDKEIKVEPFGNIRKNEQTGRPAVHETREPVVDVFEEADHTLVVAEMPGIGTDDIEVKIEENILTIRAEKGRARYFKKVVLPRSFTEDQIQVNANNGIVEVKCSNE